MNAVENFILSVDDERRDMVLYLHHLFTDRLGLKPKLRYGLPFYDARKWICYLNPKKKGGLELVFLDGQALEDPSGLLDSTGRKRVSGVTFYSLKDIPEKEIIELVEDAVEKAGT
jgi:hypothetical protein